MTEHSAADDEKAPPQVEPDKPGQRRGDDAAPPSEQPPGQPQHEPANPDDDD
ncbi:MAG TPA: hypothetical protein VJ831_05760 [Jatrophihabitantaceae bacterium]|nr:hypothetical protein [Jatrophihabitantaceae bacterium]